MAILVVQSSQWLPISVVPGTIVAVPWVMEYCPPPHSVAVGVGVKVRVGEGVRVRVLVAVGGVPVAVEVGVPPKVPRTTYISSPVPDRVSVQAAYTLPRAAVTFM